jgi:hypothetical protein
MEKKTNKKVWEKKLDAFDYALKRISDRRLESIEKSMLRPLHQEILRCIFIIIVMLFDTFVLLQLLVDVVSPFNYIAFFIVLAAMLYVEIRIYGSIWGKNGCWSLDHYRKTKKGDK